MFDYDGAIRLNTAKTDYHNSRLINTGCSAAISGGMYSVDPPPYLKRADESDVASFLTRVIGSGERNYYV
jgi:hypothetical protein